MLTYPRSQVRRPRKAYTVLFCCVDPPLPVAFTHVDTLGEAQRVYDALKAEEVSQGGGGEFYLTLWQHSTQAPRVKTMTTTDPEVTGGIERPFVYSLHYEGSSRLAEFSYMDLYAQPQ